MVSLAQDLRLEVQFSMYGMAKAPLWIPRLPSVLVLAAFGLSCLSGCGAGVALVAAALVLGGGGGGGGNAVTWLAEGLSVQTTDVAAACPGKIPREMLAEVTGLDEFVSGPNVAISFTLTAANRPADFQGLCPVEVRVEVGAEVDRVHSGKLAAGSNAITWDSTPYGVDGPEVATFSVAPSGGEPVTVETVVDNRAGIEVVEQCGLESPQCSGGLSGVVVAKYRIRSALGEAQTREAVAGTDLVIVRGEEVVRIPPADLAIQLTDAGCCAGVEPYCIEVTWDTRERFAEESADVLLGIVVEEEARKYRPALFFAPECGQKRIDNSAPLLSEVTVSSVPEGVRDHVGELVGQVRLSYKVEDSGSEACTLRLSAEFRDTGGRLVVLSTQDGSLTPVLAPEHGGTSGLATSPDGISHEFLWNSDFDVDRLVREGRLSRPFLPKVVFRLAATDETSCFPSAEEQRGAFVLDNRLVHTVAGLAPSQPLHGTTTHPRESMAFGVLSSMDTDASRTDLYLVDQLGHSLWRMDFDQGATELERVAGLGIQRFDPPEIGDGRSAISVPLDTPMDVAVLGAGQTSRVYIIEESGALWELEQGILHLLASGDSLNLPQAITVAVDAGSGSARIYVTDTGNCRVLSYDLQGGVLEVVLGALEDVQPDFPAYPEENGCNFLDALPPGQRATDIVDRPAGLAFYQTPAGRKFLLVSDTINDRILCVDLDDASQPKFHYELASYPGQKLLCHPKALRIIGDDLYVVVPNATQPLQYEGKGMVFRRRIVIDAGGLPRLEKGDLQPVVGNAAGAGCRYDLNVAPTYDDSDECSPRLEVPLSFPTDVLDDASGALYVSDGQNRRVWRLGDGNARCARSPPCANPVEQSDNNRVTTFVGTRIEGRDATEDYLEEACAEPPGPQGTLSRDSRLSEPLGMAFLTDDVALVSDRSNGRVRRLDLRTGLTTTIAGRQRTCDEARDGVHYGGDGGPATHALIEQPRGLAVFPPGDRCGAAQRRIYVADHMNHRVRCIDADGIITTCVGSGDPGIDQPLSCQEGRDPLRTFIKLPCGVAVDARGRVLVSDRRHCIMVLGTDGLLRLGVGIRRQVGDDLETTYEPSPTHDPTNGPAIGDGGPACQAALYSPGEMAFDAEERYLFFGDADNNRIRRVEYEAERGTFGVITTVVGSGRTNADGDVYGPGDGCTNVPVSYPYGVEVDLLSGALYFAETYGGGRVYRVGLSPCEMELIAGGEGFRYGSVGDGDDPLRARFLNPATVRMDAAGNLHVIDSRNHRLRRFYARE